MVAGLLAGCAHYNPQPLSAAASASALEQRRLDDPRLRRFIEAALGGDDAATVPWSLSTLTLAAIYFHPDLDLARAKLAAARAGVTTAEQTPNPTASLGLTYNSTVTTPSPWTIAPAISFLVETFGRRGYRTAEAKALADAAREDLATAGWQVRGRVRAALLDLWAAGERMRLVEEQLALQDELARLVEKRFSLGAASSLDVTRERVDRNRVRLALRDAEQLRAQARTALAIAIGIPAQALENATLSLGAFAEPARVDVVQAQGPLRQNALRQRADVQALLAQYQAAQSALQLQIAAQYPNVTLGPGYTYDQGDNKYSLAVSAELPVFNRNQGPIAEAAARRAEAGARFIALQASIIGAIDSALARYRAANATLATAEALHGAAESRVHRVERAFDAGLEDRPTLVGAKLELVTASVSRLDAERAQRQALGALEDALQQPLFDQGQWVHFPEQSPRSTERSKPQ